MEFDTNMNPIKKKLNSLRNLNSICFFKNLRAAPRGEKMTFYPRRHLTPSVRCLASDETRKCSRFSRVNNLSSLTCPS